MTEKKSLYRQCKNLVGGVTNALGNVAIAMEKMNNEMRINMGVDPNDDINTAIKKLKVQADQRYKENKEEEPMTEEELNFYFPSLPDILIDDLFDSSKSDKKH